MTDAVVYGAHQSNSEAGRLLSSFWPRVMSDVRTKPFMQAKPNSKKEEPIQELPLARIKKIMKQDGDVKMISAEAPILFSKAAEIFISELSLRAWIHTEDNKRRTLQRNDIAMAITKYDQFDFLIDIVPREELKPAKRQDEAVRQPPNVMAPEQVQYYFQLSQLQGNNSAGSSSGGGGNTSAGTPQITQLPPGAHVIQQNGQLLIATPHQMNALGAGTSTNGSPQIVQVANSEATSDSQQQQQQQTAQHQQQSQQQNTQQQPTHPSQATPTSEQSLTTTQFTPGGQQVHYVRLPQGATTANLSQVVLQQQLQHQQQQQQQQQQNAQQSQQTSVSQPQSTEARTETGYSQIYQPIQGSLPSGTVYVMAQPTSSQVQQQQSTTHSSQG